MLSLSNAVILSSKAPDKEVNVSFDKGVTTLSYNQRYLYEFLKLTNQALDKGTFSVDGASIVPLEDKKDSLFMLSINSQDIVVSSCYLLTKEIETKGIVATLKDKERREKIKAITDKFVSLKDMPLESKQDHLYKLEAIWRTLKDTSPAYVLINWNNETNKASKSDLESLIGKYSTSLTIIALEASNKQKKPLFAFLNKKKEKEEAVETPAQRENVPVYSYNEEPPSLNVEQSNTSTPKEEPRKKVSLFSKKESPKPKKEVPWTEITID